MMGRLLRWTSRVRSAARLPLEKTGSTLWVIPSMFVAGAVGLSFAAEAIDRRLSSERSTWFLFGGGPEGARELFSAVATSMLTFTGLVFSITILVLQLASNQFSPRAMRTFLKDRGSKLAMGVFVGTFVYALLGLRLVRVATEDRESFVPALSAWLTVPLALISVGAFIAYLQHVAQSIRAIVVIRRIAEDTRAALERLYPEGLGESADEDPHIQHLQGPPSGQVRSAHFGVVVSVDQERLLNLAQQGQVAFALRARLGEFVPLNSPLFDVWGDTSKIDGDAVRRCVTLGVERTLVQDASYGFRQLVDVAGRALSPAMNDPTTAAEVLDQLHDLLRRLVERRFPDASRKIDDRVVLVLPRPDWGDYVKLALDEIQQWGRDSPQVRGRIGLLLRDLLDVAASFRRAPLLRQLEMLEPRGPPVREH